MDALAIIRARKAAAGPDALAIIRARKKAEEEAAASRVEAERLGHQQGVTWKPIEAEWSAVGDEIEGGLSQVVGIGLNTFEADRATPRQAKIEHIAQNRRASIAKNANGRPVNQGNARYFDDAGVTDAALDARANKLVEIISAGKQPGVNKNYIPQLKQELAMLREQRARISGNKKPEREVVPELTPSLGDQFRARGTRYAAAAAESRRQAQPFEAERGDGTLPNLDYAIQSGLKSLPATALTLGAAFLGGPTAAAAVGGGVGGLPELARRKLDNQSDLEAVAGASRRALSDAVGEQIGGKALGGFDKVGELFGYAAKSRAGRSALAVVGETIGEEVTGLIDIGSEIIYDGKKVTVDEGIKRLIDTGVISVLTSSVTSAPIAYAAHAPEVEAAKKADPIIPAKPVTPAATVAPKTTPATDYIPSVQDLTDTESTDTPAVDKIKTLAMARAAFKIADDKVKAAKSLAEEAQKLADADPRFVEEANKAQEALTKANEVATAAQLASIKANRAAGKVNQTTLEEEIVAARKTILDNEQIAKRSAKQDKIDADKAAADAKAKEAADALAVATTAKEAKAAEKLAAEAEIEKQRIAKAEAEAARRQEYNANPVLFNAKVNVGKITASMAARQQEIDRTSAALEIAKTRDPEAAKRAEAKIAGLTRRQEAANKDMALHQAVIDEANGAPVKPQAIVPPVESVAPPIEAVPKEKKPRLSETAKQYGSETGQFTPEEFASARVNADLANAALTKARNVSAGLDVDAQSGGVYVQERASNARLRVAAAEQAALDAKATLEAMTGSVSGNLNRATLGPIESRLREAAGLRRTVDVAEARAANDRVAADAKAIDALPAITSIKAPVEAPVQDQAAVDEDVAAARKELTGIQKKLAAAVARSDAAKIEAAQNPTDVDAAAYATDLVKKLDTLAKKEARLKGNVAVAERIAAKKGVVPVQPQAPASPVPLKTYDPKKVTENAALPLDVVEVAPIAQEPVAPVIPVSEAIPVDEVKEDFGAFLNSVPEDHVNTIKLGNRGGEVGHESELDYKGPRINSSVTYLPAQAVPAQSASPVAARAPEVSISAQRDGLVRIHEQAYNAAAAKNKAVNDGLEPLDASYYAVSKASAKAYQDLKAFDAKNGIQAEKIPSIENSRSSSEPPLNPLTEAKITQFFDNKFGRGSFERAVKTGRIELHESPAVFDMPMNTEAFYEHLAEDGTGDVVHLFANNLSEQNIAGVLVHEFSHRGFVEAIGGEANAKEVYDRMRKLAETDEDVGKAAEAAKKNGGNLDRETLSAFLQAKEDSGKEIPQTIFEALKNGIRAGFYKAFKIKLKESDAAFKRRILNIARNSLKSQIQSSSKDQKRAARRAEAITELGAKNSDIDLSNIDNTITRAGKFSATKLHDNNYIFEVMNNEFVKLGGKLVDAINIPQRLNTFGSAVANAMKNIERKKDAYIALKDKLKINERDIGTWLVLKYRDAYNKKFPGVDNASGMTDAEAISEAQRLEPQAKELEQLGKYVHDIYQQAAAVKYHSGDITKAEYEAHDENYVALRGSDISELHDETETTVPSQFGKNLSGKGYKEETVRSSAPRYEDVVAHAFDDLTKSHARAEWNKVVKTVFTFAAQNPNNGIITFEPITGEEKSSLASNVLIGKVKGKAYKAVIHHPDAAKALLSSVGRLDDVTRVLMSPQRIFQKAITTSLSFVGGQLAKDNTEGYATAYAEQGAKVANGILKHQPAAMAALSRWARNKQDFNNPIDVKLDKWLRHGSLTNMSRPDHFVKLTRELNRKINATGFAGSISEIGTNTKNLAKASVNAFRKGNKGESFGEAAGALNQSFHDFADASYMTTALNAVEMATTVLENAPRFAFYLSMQENKPEVTSERAAYLSKELTTNFDRKGEWSNLIGSVVLFYNAIQLSAVKGVKLVFNKRFLKAAAAGSAISFAIGMFNAGFDDEDGNPAIKKVDPRFRASHIVFMYGGGPGEYVGIPIAQGPLSTINNWAQSAATAIKLHQRGDKEGFNRLAGDVGLASWEAFAPSTNQDKSMSIGVWDRFLNVNKNRTDTGAPIYPQAYNAEGTPLAQQTYGNASKSSQWLANGLGLLGTAGAGGKPIPAFDWSPDQLDYIAKTFIYGYMKEGYDVHRFGADYLDRREAVGSQYATNKAMGELSSLPVLKQVLGKPSSSDFYDRDLFNERRRKVDTEKAEYDRILKTGDSNAAEAYKNSSKTLFGGSVGARGLTTDGNDPRGRSKRAEREISDLNKIIRQWYNASELNDDLIDSVNDEIDISDITTTKFTPYRLVVIERLREKMNKIRHESLKE